MLTTTTSVSVFTTTSNRKIKFNYIKPASRNARRLFYKHTIVNAIAKIQRKNRNISNAYYILLTYVKKDGQLVLFSAKFLLKKQKSIYFCTRFSKNAKKEQVLG